MLIDTHSHLNFEAFDADREAVVRRAVGVGVEKIVVASVDFESSQRAVELAERFAPLYAAVGVHPQDAEKFVEEQIPYFTKWAAHPKVVAIGELGLDFYRDYNPRERQVAVLERFVELAREVQLPVIIHNREADNVILDVLSRPEFSEVIGVFHCFSSDLATAQKALDLGYYISFTGIVTFKNSNIRDVLRELPLDRLLLETDSPFLAPVPHRGKRNEPAYVHLIAEEFARVKGLSVREIEEITTENALRLFPKLMNAPK